MITTNYWNNDLAVKFEIEIDISAIVVMVFETFLSLQLRESNIHEKLMLNFFTTQLMTQ